MRTYINRVCIVFSMSDDTSIRIEKKIAKRVKKFGLFGQSWDDLLNDVADFIEEHMDDWVNREDDDEDDEEED
jgi:hypothetical protein